jgi:hypothetical protein
VNTLLFSLQPSRYEISGNLDRDGGQGRAGGKDIIKVCYVIFLVKLAFFASGERG